MGNLKNQRKTTIGTLPKITLIKKSKGFTNQCQASVLPKSKPIRSQYHNLNHISKLKKKREIFPLFSSLSRLPFLCLVSIEKLKFKEKRKRKASVPRHWVWKGWYAEKTKMGTLKRPLCCSVICWWLISPWTISQFHQCWELLHFWIDQALGTPLHAYIAKLGLDSNVSVGSSLMTMYSKFGSVGDCRKAFNHIENPDLIGWTTTIFSYAQHGWENLSFGFWFWGKERVSFRFRGRWC